LGAAPERLSQDTPLRALHNGIDANGAAAHVQWSGGDDGAERLDVPATRYSDGDPRRALPHGARHRTHESARERVEQGPARSTTPNSEEAGPYFNPRQDLEILPSLRLIRTIHQRYEARLEQSFLLGAGLYAQQGYGSATVVVAGY